MTCKVIHAAYKITLTSKHEYYVSMCKKTSKCHLLHESGLEK